MDSAVTTKIIRKLTQFECESLQEELSLNDSLWTHHSKSSALRDGRSIYINYTDNHLRYYYDNFNLFPKTYDIIKQVSEGNTISRCYWHRLMPNDTIYSHTDRSLAFVIKDQLLARYQIYLDCPNDSEFKMLTLDNDKKNPIDYQYSLIDFDLRLAHRYHNLSNKPWYFLVFDILKDGVTLQSK